jgi:hypothetical protein
MEKKSILFIGNSFTYFYDMPKAIFNEICINHNLSVDVDSITSGGYRLCQFADSKNEFGKKVYSAFINKKYDYVILQEQSNTPITNYNVFIEGATKLAKLAKENGAELYFYQTWGYQNGHSFLPECAKDSSDMAIKLKEAYCKAADELGGTVIPVGTAFLDINTNTDINIYDLDLLHPSLFGSIIAAWTIFSTIFKISPLDVDYDCELEKNISHQLKKAAEEVSYF